MTLEWDTRMFRKIVSLVWLDTFAFAYLTGAAAYALFVSNWELLLSSRQFLMDPILPSVVVASMFLLIAGTVRVLLMRVRIRKTVMLRLGVRCAARLPVMMGLTCVATGFSLVVAGAALGSKTAGDWIGDPPGRLPQAMLIVAALLCWFVFCPLAYRVGDWHSKRFRIVTERLLHRYCSRCDYDLTGLDDEAVCPECGTRKERLRCSNPTDLRDRAKRRRLFTRRRVGRAVVCLIVGGVMTVAVAWGCALFAPLEWGAEQAVGGPFYEQYRPDDWPKLDTLWLSESVRVTYRVAEGTVSIRQSVPSGANGVFEDVRYLIAERQYGLPWRSASYFGSGVFGAPQVMADPSFPVYRQPDFPLLARGIDIPARLPRWFRWRTLPLRPMWPGFLYSTLLYGTLAWLMLSTVGLWVVWWRQDRRAQTHKGS